MKPRWFPIPMFLLIMSLAGVLAAAEPVAPRGPVVMYVPAVLRGCSDPGFFDDFSDPASGWPLLDNTWVVTEYVAGEYRIAPRAIDFEAPIYLVEAPTGPRSEYRVEMDIRFIDDVGLSTGGLVFGAAPDFSSFAFFGVSVTDDSSETDLYQKYFVAHVDAAGTVTEVILPTTSTAIATGNAVNHLQVTVRAGQFTLAVNGSALGTWTADFLPAESSVGAIITPANVFDPGQSEGWIDDFEVIGCLSGDN